MAARADSTPSSDDLLNRIWYGCGWTAMLCTIGKQNGRDNGNTTAPVWMNNGTASLFGHSALVDGAKRDSECYISASPTSACDCWLIACCCRCVRLLYRQG